MLAMPEIACLRAHRSHASRTTGVRLDGPTRYHDLAPIPHSLATTFVMYVWDTEHHPVDGGPYCPAHDAVSETIWNLGVWEPSETIVALDIFSRADGATFVDMGAQIGWFTCLAAENRVRTIAIEADRLNAAMLADTVGLNGWLDEAVDVRCERITGSSPALGDVGRICLAKIDLEGAEHDALKMLWPAITAGLVDHLLVEVTPGFGRHYPELVCEIVRVGYTAFTMPPKQYPPAALTGVADLWPGRIDTNPDLAHLVAGWHQENVLFCRRGA